MGLFQALNSNLQSGNHGAAYFVLLGKLSFVYESKEKMRHKQHKCCKKSAATYTYFVQLYQ
ncbi:hypothetical protein CO674_02330 [Rhizobium hidalgonense]|uniref:Uncharacterized protein n=1 Tax=Rhizobium hidalgonense TaxID=1538159 RepID=A0ABX4JXM4_9HYPH|nr:hypothetical protein CO674_02330 [Rhizobium hidalgonense]